MIDIDVFAAFCQEDRAHSDKRNNIFLERISWTGVVGDGAELPKAKGFPIYSRLARK
jgi:hypothetical protein